MKLQLSEFTMSAWDNFFMAQVGSSAALAGLIFVGVSINMSRILAIPRLPERALQALVTLVTVLVVSSLLLIPNQSLFYTGIEILAVGLFSFISDLWITIGNFSKTVRRNLRRQVPVVVLGQFSLLLYVLAGIFTIFQGESGIYLVAPAVILSFVRAISDSWVLLVEINR